MSGTEPTFTLRNKSTGEIIMEGSLAAVTEPILCSTSRRVAEHLVRDAAIAAGRVAEINSRADAVIEREREVEAREDAARVALDAAVRRFADSVSELEHRIDAFEQAQARATLDSLPDPDDPEGRSRVQQAAEDDWLPPAMHEAPHNYDKQVLEAMLASERGADDAAESVGDLPPELALPPQSGNFVAPEDPAGTGTRSVSTGPQADARKRRFREPKPSRGKVVAQPIAISLNEE
jgi:hypothetical protein